MKKKTKNNNKNLMSIIKQVKKQNSDFFEVPKEYRNNPSIVKLQRELGIRISSWVPHSSVISAGSASTAMSGETPG